MGEVVATLKIMPESPDVDLEALKAAIQAAMPAEAEFHKIEEEPNCIWFSCIKPYFHY